MQDDRDPQVRLEGLGRWGGAQDRMLFLTWMCFDLSVYDSFGMLAAGGTIVVAEREDVLEPASLLKLMGDEGVTFWDSVPTTMNHFMHHADEMLAEQPDMALPSGLRLVFMSGDWIPVTLPDRSRGAVHRRRGRSPRVYE